MANNITARVTLIDDFSKGIKTAQASLNGFTSMFRGIRNLYFGSIGVIIPYSAIESITKANIAWTALQNKMQASFATFSTGKEEFTYIRSEADRLGIGLQTAADAYGMFSASALNAGFALKDVKEMFRNVSEAAVSIQLSPERLQLVLLAMQQLASKGKVSMEEVQRQLGESLPGAVKAGANAMKMSMSEFIKAVSTGKVMSKDFLLPFSQEIKRMLGSNLQAGIETLQASLERTKNKWFELKSALGKRIEPVLKVFADESIKVMDVLLEKLGVVKAKTGEIAEESKKTGGYFRWLKEGIVSDVTKVGFDFVKRFLIDMRDTIYDIAKGLGVIWNIGENVWAGIKKTVIDSKTAIEISSEVLKVYEILQKREKEPLKTQSENWAKASDYVKSGIKVSEDIDNVVTAYYRRSAIINKEKMKDRPEEIRLEAERSRAELEKNLAIAKEQLTVTKETVDTYQKFSKAGIESPVLDKKFEEVKAQFKALESLKASLDSKGKDEFELLKKEIADLTYEKNEMLFGVTWTANDTKQKFQNIGALVTEAVKNAYIHKEIGRRGQEIKQKDLRRKRTILSRKIFRRDHVRGIGVHGKLSAFEGLT